MHGSAGGVRKRASAPRLAPTRPEALKPLGRSNPQAFTGRTFALNRLLVPPDEGPADVGAALRLTGPEPAPERSAADEFWSDYQAGY
jgi:hypothetical protein